MNNRASFRRLAARCLEISKSAGGPQISADLRHLARSFERRAGRHERHRLPRFLLFALCLTVAGEAHAAPPEGADGTLAPWFEGLKQPGTGMGCCSIADCRPVESRVVDNHYEAFIDQRWLPIPPSKVLEYTPNPTGRAVACWTPYRGILCFVRPTET